MSKPRWTLLPIVAVIALVVGLALGSSSSRGAKGPPGAAPDAGKTAPAAPKTWTCSMHPQIRLDHPGRCPICGMTLVPVEEGRVEGEAAAVPSDALVVGARGQVMARVETAQITPRLLWKELRTVGKVQLDETSVAYLTARIPGRVDRVFADFPGTVVAKGDHLVSIYSPELLTTQEELLIALRAERAAGTEGGHVTASARRRLELWGIQPDQIDALVERGESLTHLTVFAPIGGTVVEKSIRAGQYVETGDALYTIADLSRVWVVIEVYERELPWVRFGQPVELSLESAPGAVLVGAVGFVEPVLTEETRTVRVRVVLANEGGLLKPGMFVQALVRVPVQPDGTPGPTGLEGKWACPMHPYVVGDEPGRCPVCGMPLDQVPGSPREPSPVLAVPAEAVLTTGRRQLVYVEDQPGIYRQTQPKLGPRAGSFYPVVSGLEAGQRVVTRGGFLLDSQAQIGGRPSLLYPEGISGGGAGHAGHGGMPGAAQGGQAPGGHEGHAPGPMPEPKPRAAEEPKTRPEPPSGDHSGHQGHGG